MSKHWRYWRFGGWCGAGGKPPCPPTQDEGEQHPGFDASIKAVCFLEAVCYDGKSMCVGAKKLEFEAWIWGCWVFTGSNKINLSEIGIFVYYIGKCSKCFSAKNHISLSYLWFHPQLQCTILSKLISCVVQLCVLSRVCGSPRSNHMLRRINSQGAIFYRWLNPQLPVPGADNWELFSALWIDASELSLCCLQRLPDPVTFLFLYYYPTALLTLPRITSQGTYLHPLPCLSLYHQTNTN